ncbi:MAG: endolytic transglycosylase MltG [Candidatus Margulisiibacteriota bacterium]
MKKLALIIIILLITFSLFSLLSVFLQAGTNDAPVTIEIQKGTSFNQVAFLLKVSGVIKRDLDFKIAARMLFITDKVKAGKYKFSSHPILIDVLKKLAAGEAVPEELLKVTIPEGTSIYKMGTILEKEGIACFEDFRRLTKTHLAKEYGIPDNSLEGYLFPDTYVFEKGISTEALAKMMFKRFTEVVAPYWGANKKATKYNLHEILTLASIIEKEAATSEERAIISSVFHNRLDIKMAMDACPTVKYALERPSKIVYFDQLKVKSPYNTYINRGLPPGPICSPGMESIKAAIYPAKTDYLYFVAKKDGTHIFSSNWKEHEKARISPKRKR